MNNINVLLVTESFYPDGYGGAHTYVYNLAKHLTSSDEFSTLVLTIKGDSSFLPCEKIEKIKVYRYKSVFRGKFLVAKRPILSIINSYKSFRKLLKNNKFDILNFHSVLPAFGILLYKKAKNIPKIYTFHSSFYEDVRLQMKKKKYLPQGLNLFMLRIIRYIEGKVLNNCNKIIVLSNYSRDFIIKTYHIKESKIETIPGGVDVNNFKPVEDKKAMRKRIGLPVDKFILFTTRRLVARMGIENLILATKDIVKIKKNTLLLIAGEGFLRKRLEDIIMKENLKDNINILGQVDMKNLPAFYQAADLFIMPSEEAEWFGLSTLEALSCDVPVMGTPIGATLEILKPLDQTLLFKDASPKAIANGLMKLLSSPDKLNSLNQKCRNYVVENFSWDSVIPKIERIFKKVL